MVIWQQLLITLGLYNMGIIGLVGFIGSGKGTVADILVNQHGFKKESFANGVKDAIAPIFGWNRDWLEGDTPESRKWREEPDEWWSEQLGREITPRLALQLMGTECGRNVFHKDIWIHSLLRRLSSLENYVIADVRFPNEIDAIRKAGGLVFRVRRGSEPEWYNLAETYNSTWNWSGEVQVMKDFPDVHYSEWAWIGKGINGTISNNSSLEDLEKYIDFMMENAV